MSKFTDFLEHDTTANSAPGRSADFDSVAKLVQSTQRQPVKFGLLSLGVVSFAGEDAQSFVNAQFTTNCLEITPAHGQFSAWCDPKGRVMYLFVLYRDDERFYAILPKAQIRNFVSRLRMYVLRAEVQIEDLSETVAVFGLSGESTRAERNAGPLLRPWDCGNEAGSVLIRYGPGAPRFLLVGPDATAIERWQALQLPTHGEDIWNALDICDGLPRLDETSAGKFLPQNLNLDVLDAVSFAKGCYPGQEIIARLKYRGTVKQRLLAATMESDMVPDAGTAVDAPARDGNVGHVVSAQRLNAKRSVISAVVDVGAATGDLSIAGVAGMPIDLPYAVD